MIFRILSIALLLMTVGVLERTLLAALAGGIWTAHIVLAIALTRMTVVRGRGVLAWVGVTAFVMQVLSHQPFGVAFCSTVLGLACTRIMSFYVFSHQAFFARALSVFFGIALASFSGAGFAFLLATIDRSTAAPVVAMHLSQIVHGLVTTTIGALGVLALVAVVEPKVRWIFRGTASAQQRFL